MTTVKARRVAYAEPPNPGYNQRGDTRPQRRDSFPPVPQPPASPARRADVVQASDPGRACQQGVHMTALSDDVEVREGTYGEKVIAVEPGGAEFIPLNERHGRPLQLFWTWTSPNMEFATVFVGLLGILSSASASGRRSSRSSSAPRSARSPRASCRPAARSTGCRRWCSAAVASVTGATSCPAGINSVVAGIGWFAVNSVSGALALNALTHMPEVLCLLHRGGAAARGGVPRPQLDPRV